MAERNTSNEASAPADQAGTAELIRAGYEANRPVYPVGGGTALDYGSPPSRPGRTLNLTTLNRIVDYTPRDMTILVEAGVRMTDLAAALAAEGQHLPIDVPRAREATLGGVVATNWNGPRRYGHGTIRDYVIGIHAVDGRGVAFKGGGRVVKNVAGYDFCKLLTGSLGTLGVLTQLALKVKPKPEVAAAVVASCSDIAAIEGVLGRLINLPAPPVAIDVLIGSAWGIESATPHQSGALVVRIEGTEPEVDSLAEQTQYELWSGGASDVRRMEVNEVNTLWPRQIEFSDRGPGDQPDESPLVVKIAVPPSAVTATITELLSFDAGCTVQAHAGNGIIVARFSQFSHADMTNVLVAKLRPAAIRLGGTLIIVSSKLEGLTPHLIWGGRTEATVLAERIKQQLDPRGVLNPGRFIYDDVRCKI